MSEQRQPGFYWVSTGFGLFIAEYYNGEWTSTQMKGSYTDHAFDEISQRITPSMRFTEEDMIEFAWYCQKNGNGRLVHEILENWIEQKDKQREEENSGRYNNV